MPRFLFRRRSFLLGTGSVLGAAAFGAARPAFADTGAPQVRRNHALLVAVTEYPNLFRSEWLEGPNNDALMMRDYLLTDAPVSFAPEDIRVLATGLDDAQAEPTREAIAREMARLAELAERGDFVILHFAGHGIEQPARFPEEEVDGRDQVFMPKDVQRMTQALGHWPNGYVDKDIRDDITAIRNKGAQVWAIFDCCHSGTMTRALDMRPAGEVSRKIDLNLYEIPHDMWGQARTRATLSPQTGPSSMFGPAGMDTDSPELAPLVAFFAAQTTEETPELPLPQHSEGAIQMGLFSFTLLAKLRENPRMSYQQLGQAIHHAYLGMNRVRPSPLFEGALNAPVFGSADGLAYVPQWRISGTGDARQINAGHMHLLSPGTRLAVLAEPSHTLADALGVVEIASASALRSTLAEVSGDADPDLPSIALSDIPEQAYALLLESVVSFELTVAPPQTDGPHAALAEQVTEWLTDIAQDTVQPIRLRLVAPEDAADIRFDIRSEAEVAALMYAQGLLSDSDARLFAQATQSQTPRLWLLDTSASHSLRPTERPFSRALDPDTIGQVLPWLRQSLGAVYRATNLSRLAQFDDFGETDVQVQVTRLPEFLSPLAQGEALALHRTSIVQPGNTGHVRVENLGNTPVDVNILYIGSNYAITSMLEAPVRLRAATPDAPNAVYSEEVVEFDDTSFGRERLMVIVTAAQAQENPLDLSFLEQGGVRAIGRGPGAVSDFGAMIETMATAATTRGGSSLAARRAAAQGQRGAIYVYSVENVPAS